MAASASQSLALPAKSTRSRLVEAAGEIFASRGFEAATVKEITETAAVNVASVNYHFGDKLALYAEVLHQSLFSVHTLAQAPGGIAATPQERLAEFLRGYLKAMLGAGRPSWCGRLMARELADPTPALPQVITEIIEPNARYLRGLVSEIAGLPVDDERVRLAAHSVIGQCVHWVHACPILPYLWPELRMTEEQIERIATHITVFSLAGIRAITADATPAPAPVLSNPETEGAGS